MVVISAVSANIRRTNEGLCFTIITYNTPDLLIIFFFFYSVRSNLIIHRKLNHSFNADSVCACFNSWVCGGSGAVRVG